MDGSVQNYCGGSPAGDRAEVTDSDSGLRGPTVMVDRDSGLYPPGFKDLQPHRCAISSSVIHADQGPHVLPTYSFQPDCPCVSPLSLGRGSKYRAGSVLAPMPRPQRRQAAGEQRAAAYLRLWGVAVVVAPDSFRKVLQDSLRGWRQRHPHRRSNKLSPCRSLPPPDSQCFPPNPRKNEVPGERAPVHSVGPGPAGSPPGWPRSLWETWSLGYLQGAPDPRICR